jgi:hypothetical protein
MPALKKRKLTSTKTKEASPDPENTADAADAFRKFFESQFQPLDPDTARQKASEVESDEFDEDGESGEDFDGFSEEDDESDDEERVPEVKVVEHADVKNEDVILDKKARKALLVRLTPRKMDSLYG